MKKDYQRPRVKTHSVELNQMVCQSVKSIESGSAGLKSGGGGSGVARGRKDGDWDED